MDIFENYKQDILIFKKKFLIKLIYYIKIRSYFLEFKIHFEF